MSEQEHHGAEPDSGAGVQKFKMPTSIILLLNTHLIKF